MITDYSKYLGAKFYKIEEDKSINRIRVISFANTDTARVQNEKTEEVFKIPFAELFEEYALLNPQGYIYFNIVNLQGDIKDVIVALYRAKDMEQNKSDPYCTCRQNINDILGQMININKQEAGCCLSIETVPDGIDYKVMRACNSIDFFTSVAIYDNDKLSDILHCIKKINKYDEVLEKLFIDNANRQPAIFKSEILSKQKYKGYCRTLKSLLEDNEFMYEFRRGFGIAEIPVDIKASIIEGDAYSGCRLNLETMFTIQKYYNFYLNNALVLAYDKDVNVSTIVRDKVLICDSNEDIYLIVYDKGNAFENSNLNDTMTASEKLQNIMSLTNK